MGLMIFFSWWYTEGWANSFKAIGTRVDTLAKDLSIPILLRTLFEPWKQIKINTGQNASIDLKMHVLAENLFSRFFGFIIRSFVIVFGTIAIILLAAFGIVLAIIWPIIPFLPLAFIFMAVTSI